MRRARVSARAPGPSVGRLSGAAPGWVLALVLLLGVRAAGGAPAVQDVRVDGAVAQVMIDGGAFSAGAGPVIERIRRAMQIVAHYYGAFPVATLRIVVLPAPGARVHGATTFGAPHPLIRVRIGSDATPATLASDWVLVHEMVHLALPDVGETHAWLSEGLATYVEGVARAQLNDRAIEDVWAEAARSMPKGLPQPGDSGLDQTHTWGRTYWGGALFCLLADIDIRRRTSNRLGLRDALRAILKASGGLGTEWPIERVLAAGDGAVGAPVLERLYARMKDRPETTDLPALWRELGIEPEGDTVRLRDDAPLAAIRIAITR